MGRLQHMGAGLLAVVWLTSCAAPGHEPEESQRALVAGDTPSFFLNDPPTERRTLPRDTLSDLLGRSSPPTATGAPCDPALTDSLVTRELSRLLSQGQTLEKYKFADPSAQAGEMSLQERVQAFRQERVAHYDKLFACTPGNEGINQLAQRLRANPNDRTAMDQIFVGLVENRGEEVLALYRERDFTDLADMIMQAGLSNLRVRYADLNRYLKEDDLKRAIHDRIESQKDELSLLALKGELITVFQSTGYTQNERFALQLGIQSIVAEETTKHLIGNLRRSMPSGIERTHQIEI